MGIPLKAITRAVIATDGSQWSTLPLRLPLAAVFMAHGAQKAFGWFDGPGIEGFIGAMGQMGMQPAELLAYLAAYGEFGGGLLILLGLLTRFGALNIVVIMLVAIFFVHWGKFFAPEGMEYNLMILGAALSLLITGGGALSLDAKLFNRQASQQRIL